MFLNRMAGVEPLRAGGTALRLYDKESVDRDGAIEMATYLTAFKQSPDTWARLAANPVDRRETLGPLIEKLGGRLVGYWYAFGDVDGYALIEAPDDVVAASLLVKVAASGAMSVSTTKLMTVEEALQAFRRASDIDYRPPGS